MMRTAYRLVDLPEGDVTLPESTEVVPPQYPRGELAAEDGTRRSQLVLWLTSRDNRFFSRAAVNWAWSHLFGRPLVATLDDPAKPAADANAALLDELAGEFVRSGYDLQALWRALAGTRAYQLSTRHDDAAAARPELFARMLPKPLSPEQLFDSFAPLAPAATGSASVGTAGAGGRPRGWTRTRCGWNSCGGCGRRRAKRPSTAPARCRR